MKNDEQPTSGMRSRWSALAVCFIPAALQAIILARMATWSVRTIFASPVSPILLGAALGASLVVLANYAGGIAPSRLKVGAVVLALICVIAEHLFYYIDYTASFASAAKLQVEEQTIQAAGGAQPAGFGEFLQAGAARTFGIFPGWLWWIIDASLTVAASLAVVALMPNRVSPAPKS
jgi:hypothetical protein